MRTWEGDVAFVGIETQDGRTMLELDVEPPMPVMLWQDGGSPKVIGALRKAEGRDIEGGKAIHCSGTLDGLEPGEYGVGIDVSPAYLIEPPSVPEDETQTPKMKMGGEMRAVTVYPPDTLYPAWPDAKIVVA